MQSMAPPLFDWPWKLLGTYKYHLFLPIAASAMYAHYGLGTRKRDNTYLHIFIISALRYVQYQTWTSFSRLHATIKRHQIRKYALDFQQVDLEFHNDNWIIFQALLATVVFPSSFNTISSWNAVGLAYLFLLHAGVTELLYYWTHRALHSSHLFSLYHHLHHASPSPEPATAGMHTFLEELLQATLMTIPITWVFLLGGGSLSMVYIYPLAFDFLKQMGHFNSEIVPLWLFRVFPVLKYLLYTPSYHSLHHTDLNSNFCLFMPLYDHLGGTWNRNTDKFHAQLRLQDQDEVPHFVFLVHMIDMVSSLQGPFCGRTVSSAPFATHWYQWFVLPLGFISAVCLWLWGRVFVSSGYFVDGIRAQNWVVPRYGFHYFLPFCAKRINELIEEAILEADAMGVRVVNLAALNKNEALNGGGLMFVEKHRHLKVRVVHGNTLTTAIVIKELAPATSEVFLTGATSKIGRAIALYLCQRNIRVMMLTNSRQRYQSIFNEAPAAFRCNLVQVTKYQAGQTCKTWVVGKWAKRRDQDWAPAGTHFHQFVVPPIHQYRKDCSYGKMAGMRLPPTVKGLYSCEYTLGRGVVAACHAGGLLHALEGWRHHEVGSIDVDLIDKVWEAAIKHGFAPVY